MTFFEVHKNRFFIKDVKHAPLWTPLRRTETKQNIKKRKNVKKTGMWKPCFLKQKIAVLSAWELDSGWKMSSHVSKTRKRSFTRMGAQFWLENELPCK